MSFKWKGLLGVGAAGFGLASSSAANPSTNPSSTSAFTLADEEQWARQIDDPHDLPNILGMDNFGNTCYVNSVLQALYLCDPFRESLLAYNLSTVKTPRGRPAALPPTTPTHVQPLTPRATAGERSLSPGRLGGSEEMRTNTESLFYALRTLFQRMAMATTAAAAEPPQTPTASSSSSSSYLGGTLSRKVTSRPGTSGGTAAGAAQSQSAQPNGGTVPNMVSPSASNGDGSANQCSDVVVSDSDIKAFLALLKKSNILFDSTAHQDAHELLNFVLNRIGEDIVEEARADGRTTQQQQGDDVHGVGTNGTTLVHRLFEGVLTNETRCLTCESVTSRDDSFLDLSLDIERNTSVTACLRQFSASEMLCARNKFFCDTCSGLQEAEKRMKIKKLPNVLALHLKRFKYEESVQRFVKLAYRVVFPMQLRLCNTSDDASDPDKLYELYGIIVHIGIGPHHGHYIAIVKVGQRWFVFDDETISVIDAADISRYFGDTPGVGSAYVLFYQAVDLDMTSLGLPDVKAMREEKARLRREASVRRHVQQQQQQNGNGHGTGGFTLGFPPASAATSMAGVEVFDPPSRSTTPSNEGRAVGGGLFGRRQNSLSQQLAAAGSPGGGITAVPTTGSVPMLSSLSGEQSDGGSSKGSGWLSSLRSRKPSAALSSPGGGPSLSVTVSGLPHSPTPQYKANVSASSPAGYDEGDNADGDELRGERGAGESEGLAARSGTPFRQRSPARASDAEADDALLVNNINAGGSSNGDGTGHVTPHSNISAAPSLQGAAFTPVERALTKKEQDKIAKQARRKGSLSAGVHDAASPYKEMDGGEVNAPPPPFDPLAGSDTLPPSTSTSGWRRVASVANSGAGVVRRPSTADPSSGEQSTASRRRSTLSRTFGFGRNKDKA